MKSFENKRYVVWDWNGTLFRDMEVCMEIENEFLRERNLPEMESVEYYQSVFQFPVKAFYEELGLDFTKESYEELSNRWVSEYEDRIHRCELNHGTETVLNMLKENGYSQTIISASGQESLFKQISPFNIEPFFDDILGISDNMASSKAHIAQKWIEKKNISPDEVVFFGDTEHDYDVAKEAGCDCVLIADGHNSKAHLAGLGVQVLDTINEVPMLLGL